MPDEDETEKNIRYKTSFLFVLGAWNVFIETGTKQIQVWCWKQRGTFSWYRFVIFYLDKVSTVSFTLPLSVMSQWHEALCLSIDCVTMIHWGLEISKIRHFELGINVHHLWSWSLIVIRTFSFTTILFVRLKTKCWNTKDHRLLLCITHLTTAWLQMKCQHQPQTSRISKNG